MAADLASCMLLAIAVLAAIFGIAQQRGYTPPAPPPTPPDTRQPCDGDDWREDPDPWRCGSVFCDDQTVHRCAASYDHPEFDPGSDHVDYLGHRWPQSRPPRSWLRSLTHQDRR